MPRPKLETLTKNAIRNYSGTTFYVLNTSDLDGREKRAEVLMTFGSANGKGKDKTVSLKSTWIPIDLMTEVSLEAIKSNEDFWHHFNRRAITVVDSDAAEEFLETEDAREEYDRIYEIGTESKARDKTPQTVDMEERIMQQSRGQLAKGNLKREEGSAKVISIMKRESLSESQRLGALRNIEHELSKQDFSYIIKSARSENQDRIKEWASTAASRL